MADGVQGVIESARAFLGDRITTNNALREHHSHGQDTQPPHMPDAVALLWKGMSHRCAEALLSICRA